MNLFELLSTASDQQYSRDRRIYGVVVGIVEDIRDAEKLGRVKVIFPWLAEQEDDTVRIEAKQARAHSYWARISTLMAGKGRGSYFVPDPGDEVLCAFEHGEVDRPVILGALWNREDEPPQEMDGEGKNNLRGLHSRSGHKFVFDDSTDKSSILIMDQTTKNSIFIDSANRKMVIEVEGDLEIKVQGNINITANQNITIEAKGNLNLKAQGNGALEASGPLSVKSSASLAMDGTVQTEVKAATVSVNGSGLAEIKGALVKIN
jgi:uncharacterized protein involved in type VI secretion and phage assembly